MPSAKIQIEGGEGQIQIRWGVEGGGGGVGENNAIL